MRLATCPRRAPQAVFAWVDGGERRLDTHRVVYDLVRPMSVTGEMIDVAAPAGAMPAYLARPGANGSWPGDR